MYKTTLLWVILTILMSCSQGFCSKTLRKPAKASKLASVHARWDPKPRCLLYLPFNQGIAPLIGTPLRKVGAAPFKLEKGKIKGGLSITKGIKNKRKRSLTGEPAHYFNSQRGTVSFWFKLNREQIAGSQMIFGVFGNDSITCSVPKGNKKNAKLQPGSVSFRVAHEQVKPGLYESDNSISTAAFPFLLKKWYHVVWTRQGRLHRVYLNGKLSKQKILFPWSSKLKGRFDISAWGHGTMDVSLDEFGIYNFPFTASEVKADFRKRKSRPIKPMRRKHGLSITAVWGPGEKKCHVTADTGNDYEKKAARFLIEALDANDKIIGTATISKIHRGFVDLIFPVKMGKHAVGIYRVRAKLFNSRGRVLDKAESEPYEVYENDWLGNQLGVTDKIQPPWTPIEVDDATLKVWGRRYVLKGGYGLPVQIVSKDKILLAKPVELKLIRKGVELKLSDLSVKLTEVKAHKVKWVGYAKADDVRIRIQGYLEYDGMMLLKLFLEPVIPGETVQLDRVYLDTVLLKQRALFMNTTAGGGWSASYSSRIPSQTGRYYNNLDHKGKDYKKFLFYVTFSDHERGLEWFADKPENWIFDYSQPIQEMYREEDGNVKLRCLFFNVPHLLDKTLKFTFGYDAMPVKPLPAHWRDTYKHYHPVVTSHLHMKVIWQSPVVKKYRPVIYALCPDDPQSYGKAVRKQWNNAWIPKERMWKRYLLPYLNQHVVIPGPMHGGPSKEGWKYLNHLLKAETSNDGWTALPSRGMRDYWAYNLNKFIKEADIDGFYIDEASVKTYGVNILSGSGYIKPDGTYAAGHNTLGMREQLKRTRQLFIDNGKRPLVMIPVYRKMIPHAFAFVDVVAEGEAHVSSLRKKFEPDWIDLWGNGAKGDQPQGPSDWLLFLGRADKFGFIPLFFDYIGNYHELGYLKAQQARYALLSLLDIIPDKPVFRWWFSVRERFGIGEAEVLFHPYFQQKAIISDDPNNVLISYYSRKKSYLLMVSNLGQKDYSGKIKINGKDLGLDLSKVTVTDYTGESYMKKVTKANKYNYKYDLTTKPMVGRNLDLVDGKSAINLNIQRHDFKMIFLSDSNQQLFKEN